MSEVVDWIFLSRTRLAEAIIAYKSDDYRATVQLLGEAERYANKAKVIADDKKREQMRKTSDSSGGPASP